MNPEANDFLHTAVGIADVLSAGIGPLLRWGFKELAWLGYDDYANRINYCSNWYKAGNLIGALIWVRIISAAGSNPVDNERGGAPRKLRPDQNAEGDHSTYDRDPETGGTRKYSSWEKGPDGWRPTKHYHGDGGEHYNKKDGKWVPAPHVHDPKHPGGVRPPRPGEMPLIP